MKHEKIIRIMWNHRTDHVGEKLLAILEREPRTALIDSNISAYHLYRFDRMHGHSDLEAYNFAMHVKRGLYAYYSSRRIHENNR